MKQNMNDDAALLRRYAEERNEAAFAELVQRHLALVYGAALRQLDGATHRAEEVAQSVFTDLARKAASLSERDDLVGWLYTSTHFATAKLKRTEQRRQQREQEASTMHELLSACSSDDIWERLRPVLDDAMHELDARDRDVILQRFFQGHRLAEVGDRLGISDDAARMRIERALEKLRVLLARRQITSTTAALAVALVSQPAVAVPGRLVETVANSALSSANIAAAPALSFFQIMSTSKIAVGIAGLLFALTLGVATREFSRREAVEANLAAAKRDYAAQVVKTRDLEQNASTAEKNLALLKQSLEERSAAQAAAKARTAGEASVVKAEPAWDSKAEGRAFLDRHSETKRALDDYVSASKRFQYAPMYRALGFSPEQIRRWEAFTGAGTTMGADLGNGRVVSLPYPDRPAGSNRDQQMQEMLGAEWPRRLEEFGSIAAARGVAADVAGSLYFTDTPLAAEQVDRLVQILVESQNRGPKARASAYDWNAVIAKADAVLTAPQVAVLAGKRATDQFQQALNRPRAPAAGPATNPSAAQGK